jgi:hypothetical protein
VALRYLKVHIGKDFLRNNISKELQVILESERKLQTENKTGLE